MSDFNSSLARAGTDQQPKGSPAGLEVPDKVENIAWQTRSALPTPDEDALADALQALFNAEIYELPKVVEGLNARGVKPPAGAPRWTEEIFRSELARLGK
jgi:hypothetical protein